MKTQIQIKSWQYLQHLPPDRGFTFFGLMMAATILVISGAIALPIFLNTTKCGGKGKQSEAKNFISAINKAEIAYYTEANTKKPGIFADSMEQLELGLPQETTNYHYKIVTDSAKYPSVISLAISKATRDEQLKSYIGGVFVIENSKKFLMVSGICESNLATTKPPVIFPTLNIKNQQMQCPSDYKLLDSSTNLVSFPKHTASPQRTSTTAKVPARQAK